MMRRPGCDENAQGRGCLRSPRLSCRATFKTQRQLVAKSLVFDRCRNDRFVEKFVKAGYIGQLIGALLNESAVGGAAARPSPGGNSAIAILERLSRTCSRSATVAISGYDDGAAGQSVNNLVAPHRVSD